MLYRYEIEFRKNGNVIVYGLARGVGGMLDIVGDLIGRIDSVGNQKNVKHYSTLLQIQMKLERLKEEFTTQLVDPLHENLVENLHNARSWFTEHGREKFAPGIEDLQTMFTNPLISIVEHRISESELDRQEIVYRDLDQVIVRFNDYRKDIHGRNPMESNRVE